MIIFIIIIFIFIIIIIIFIIIIMNDGDDWWRDVAFKASGDLCICVSVCAHEF